MATFRVTYDRATFESSEAGEYAESGYASPGGWQHADPAELTLRDAIKVCGMHPRTCGPVGGFLDAGRWFERTDSDTDYRTGDETRYSLHPPETITAASYRRLSRYLCGRPFRHW